MSIAVLIAVGHIAFLVAELRSKIREKSGEALRRTITSDIGAFFLR